MPVLRLADVVLFNEKIVKGCCDICDWAIIGRASLVQSYSMRLMLKVMSCKVWLMSSDTRTIPNDTLLQEAL